MNKYNNLTIYSLLTHDGRRLVERKEGNSVVQELVPEKDLPAGLPPMRKWTIYALKSAHVDLGLHTPPYNAYAESIRRIRLARDMIAADTAADDDPAAFRWFPESWAGWRPFAEAEGDAARAFAREMTRHGRFSCGVTCAGNHVELYGYAEMERSLDGWKALKTDGLANHTMFMTDMPGIGWGIVVPYAAAGVKNVGWWPNRWNMRGQSRLDFGSLTGPRSPVFWWEGPDGKSRLFVWSGPDYGGGGAAFGLRTSFWDIPSHPIPEEAEQAIASYRFDLAQMEQSTARTLAQLESEVPYDIWIYPDYQDDEPPNPRLADAFRIWNEKWAWPCFRTVGNLDEPFDRFREKWGAHVPVVRGQITNAWSFLPVGYPDFLARKLNADRLLPAAEATAAIRSALTGADYPAADMVHAWEALNYCDEHGMGGCAVPNTYRYPGRRGWETWMQNWDWLEFIERIARREVASATPPATGTVITPGTTGENRWYRVRLNAAGEIESIFDKELARELLAAPANRLIYSRDGNETFEGGEALDATITRRVALRGDERAVHVETLIENPRDLWHPEQISDRFGYLAFPFDVPDFTFAAQICGPVIDPHADIAGVSSDAFVAVRDWCAADGDGWGVGLVMHDSALTEFGGIARDIQGRTGRALSSAIYPCLFNNAKAFAEVPGARELRLCYRYAITSYRGTWRKAGVPALAARWIEPGMERVRSRFRLNAPNVSLIAFRRADNGRANEAILRETHGREVRVCVATDLFPGETPTAHLTPWSTVTVAFTGNAAQVREAAGEKGPTTRLSPMLVLGALIAGAIDIMLYLRLPDPPNTTVRDSNLWRNLIEPARNPLFKRFITYACFWSIALQFGSTFLVVYSLKILKLPPYLVMLYWSLQGIGSAIASGFWGKMADRFGHKPVLRLCVGFKPVLFIGYLLATPSNMYWLIPLLLFPDGLANAGYELANQGYLLTMSPQRNRSMFIAAQTGLSGICGGLSVIVSGALLQKLDGFSFDFAGRTWINYHIIFAICALLRMSTQFFISRIHEPEAVHTRVLLRNMLDESPLRALQFPVGLFRRLNPFAGEDEDHDAAAGR